MKKLSTIIAGSAITLLALTACGQEGTPEAEGEGGTQAEAPEYTVAEDVDLSDSETWEAANSAGTLTLVASSFFAANSTPRATCR